MSHKVTFGVTQSGSEDAVGAIKAGVAQALMEAGLPGSFSIPLDELGVKGLTGQLHFKPTIGKKDGRVMYNITNSSEVIMAGVKVKPMGNWFLPKQGFTVDGETLKAYQAATIARDEKRKANSNGTISEADLEEGETTE